MKISKNDLRLLRLIYDNRWYPLDPIDKGEITEKDIKRLAKKGLVEIDGLLHSLTIEGAEAINVSIWD